MWLYYLICILFYVAFLFAAFMLLKYILKKPEKNDKKKFASVFWEKSTNARNRSYIRSRKKRVKSLPLYQRFVYWLWFCSIVILIFIQPVLFSVIRYYFIKSFIFLKIAFILRRARFQILLLCSPVFYAEYLLW